MQMGKSQASQRPMVLGSLRASTYGLAIPTIYGRTQSPLLAIWANGLRSGAGLASAKKLKSKKGTPNYVENIDFLIGKNPVRGPLQMWYNGGLYPLADAKYTVAVSGSTETYAIPDTHFYALIAVTLTVPYSFAVNDYGGGGAQTLAGSYEIPLWNQLEQGPDPTSSNQARTFPYTYRWQPGYGATVYVDNADRSRFPGGSSLNFYYAQLMPATSYQPPASRIRLAFEARLASGSEYASFPAEQMIMPQFAGMGSSNIDLGSSGTIPAIKAEIQGKWGIYPSGDCDFADIIEDIVKGGVAQAALGSGPAYTPVEHGLSQYDFPGAVQTALAAAFEDGINSVTFDRPNTAGNTLVAFLDCDGGTGIVVTDSAGNVWTRAATADRVVARNCTFACYYCVGCVAAASNTVSFTNSGFYTKTFICFELAGVDAFDAVSAVSVGSNPGASITTTNAPGQAALILAFSLQTGGGNVARPNTNRWRLIVRPFHGGDDEGNNFVQQMNVRNPGTYSLNWLTATAATDYIFLLAFKATQGNTHALAGGDFLDQASLDLVRQQCRANGLWGSLTMTAQQPARSWLEQLYVAANAAPVYSGFTLKSISRSEVSTAGNGATYTAPTAAGPVADLSTLRGDFLGATGEAPITIKRKSRVDLDNVLQMQHINRASNYGQVVTVQPEAAAIALYGPRKAAPIVNNAVQDTQVARSLLAVATRNQLLNDRTYEFKLSSRWQLLESMDLVTLTDPEMGLFQQPVRLTQVKEETNFDLSCVAEPFVYGMNSPVALGALTTPTPYVPNTGTDPGSINAPVFVEPMARLTSASNAYELWIVLSGGNANYGGAQLYLSTDAGASYSMVGVAQGNAPTGTVVADWPAHADPDAANDLLVDLTESLGQLPSYAVAEEDSYKVPCYVAGGSGAIAYELMTYAVATLTAANKYTLSASAGNHLRRGVYGAPAAGVGVDHPVGSRFAVLAPGSTAIVKLKMDPAWIGQTLHFKATAFNQLGGGMQSLSSVTDYTYTPNGSGGGANPAGAAGQFFQINGA